MEDVREFPNNFPDYNGQTLLEVNGEVNKKATYLHVSTKMYSVLNSYRSNSYRPN